MAYLAPIHQASSVRHALRINFLNPDEESLILAKNNRLEVYSQTEDGLSLKHSKAIYGRVTMLDKIRPTSSSTHQLFVGTDCFMYFILSWNSKTNQLRTERSYINQADKSARDSQTGDRCNIDPSRSFMTLELYEGVVTIVPIATKVKKIGDPEIGTLGEPIPTRIPEMFVRSSAFFEQKIRERNEKPKLALLYEDNYKKVKLKLRQIEYSPGLSGDGPSAELTDVEGFKEQLELGASHIIPVASPACGLIILGETSITYWENSERQKLRRPLKEATIFTTWEQIDYQRYIFADEYGKLYLFMLDINERDVVTGWKLDVIGETSKASVLVYLGEGRLFVGSHQADSQVITIKPQAIDIVQTIPNIAPILDFTIMDMGNRSGEGQNNEFSSGQARLVTGSGAFKDGSLRSVRSGVGLEDLGLLDEMENITSLFSLKTEVASQYDDILVVSFVNETRVFQFSADGDVEELREFGGMRLDAGTLFVGNVAGGKVVQVIQEAVQIADLESGMISADWNPPANGKVTAVTSNVGVLVAAVNGTELYALELQNNLEQISKYTVGAESQIACVNLPTTDSGFCIVGFWGTSTISVLNLRGFSTIHQADAAPGEVTVPRSLCLANILQDQPPVLFVALADGNIVTFSMNPTTGELTNRKSIVLGTQQADLKILPRADGLHNVFATCEYASLIYGSEGRLTYSAVTAENASCVCPFNAECYPGAIAIATKEDLRIALVDEERSTHVQGQHVGETVRRIAHSPKLQAFGLGTIKRTLEGGVEIVKSHFKLADEVTFNVQATFPLNDDELMESVMRAELPDGHGKYAERFVIGTAYVDEESTDSIRGRLIILEVTEDRQVKVVTELAVRGACRCLAMVDGKIVAALIKTVVIYTLEYTTPSQPALIKNASYRTSTAPISLAVHTLPDAGKHVIAIADLMKSVSVVQYSRGQAGLPDSLTEVARHFQTTWATAVGLIDPEENTYLEADAEGNLMVLRQDVKGVMAEDRRRLQVTSEMCLNEVVNRIRRIDVPVPPSAPVVPRAFVATVEGSIHLFATINAQFQDLLMRLQNALAEMVRSPGDVPFGVWRAFKNQVREEAEPFRFVDGELIEGFLDLNNEIQEEVLKKAGVDNTRLEEIRAMVEGLKRLR